jgi:hypothetical protein
MPIRLNLLAEAQAAEDLRRRDPVKRAVWLAGLVIAALLVWSSFLQLRLTLASSEVSSIENRMNSKTNEYRQLLDNQKKTTEINDKLAYLRLLATNRFLNGNLLNALQKTTTDDAQLIRLRIEQLYTKTEATKTRTNEHDVIIKGKPATMTEKIVLILDGLDLSRSPGDEVNRFKSVLTSNAYFKTMLVKTNPVTLRSLSAVQPAPGSGQPSVTFNLECRYEERTR